MVRVQPVGAQPVVFDPKGLPNGITSVSMANQDLGWALYSTSSCSDGKKDCTTKSGLVVTHDGGQTWEPDTPG